MVTHSLRPRSHSIAATCINYALCGVRSLCGIGSNVASSHCVGNYQSILACKIHHSNAEPVS